MYLLNRNLFQGFLVILLFSSCSPEKEDEANRTIYYFDLHTFFKEKAKELKNENPLVQKSVSKNNSEESKKIKIKNWEEELAYFIDADINKDAWKDSYKKDSSSNRIVYTAKDIQLKTQKIEINLIKNSVNKVIIHTKEDNLLYHTIQELEFYTDSLYSIKKHQKVIILGSNNYQIEGKF